MTAAILERALREACAEVAEWRAWYGDRDAYSEAEEIRKDVDDIVTEFMDKADGEPVEA